MAQQVREGSMVRRVLFAAWLVGSRVGALFVLLQAYTTLRKRYFQRPAEVAFDHALDLLALQARLGIDVELDVQRWALGHQWMIDFFNIYYRQMKLGLYLPAALAVLLAPVAFRRIALAFVVGTLLAAPWYALYPLAPPRFMGPYGFPFVDTLAVFAPVEQVSGAMAANPFAAMPSMHVGWTAIAACWLAAALPRWRLGPLLAVLHVVLMSVATVITGNHYVLDVVAGLAVAGAAFALARVLPLARSTAARPRPAMPESVPASIGAARR